MPKWKPDPLSHCLQRGRDDRGAVLRLARKSDLEDQLVPVRKERLSSPCGGVLVQFLAALKFRTWPGELSTQARCEGPLPLAPTGAASMLQISAGLPANVFPF